MAGRPYSGLTTNWAISPAMISPPGHQACRTLSLCVFWSGYMVAARGLIEISTSPLADPVMNDASHSTQNPAFGPADGNSDQPTVVSIQWDADARLSANP